MTQSEHGGGGEGGGGGGNEGRQDLSAYLSLFLTNMELYMEIRLL